jgi:hypothetical protein
VYGGPYTWEIDAGKSSVPSLSGIYNETVSKKIKQTRE